MTCRKERERFAEVVREAKLSQPVLGTYSLAPEVPERRHEQETQHDHSERRVPKW